jgi:hypothetical protein
MNSNLSILFFYYYVRITRLRGFGHLYAYANRRIVDNTGNLHRQQRVP